MVGGLVGGVAGATVVEIGAVVEVEVEVMVAAPIAARVVEVVRTSASAVRCRAESPSRSRTSANVTAASADAAATTARSRRRGGTATSVASTPVSDLEPLDSDPMATIAVTGSAGGMGVALRARLEQAGDTVIGIDVRDAEVIADLATTAGRAAMVDAVADRCGGSLDGLVVAAGITHDEGSPVVSINYFGAVATLVGLRPLLARGTDASAVVVGSNSCSTQPGLPLGLVEACLAGDEDAARAEAGDGVGAYGASKLALARWVRRQAPTPEWIGAGIRLNAVAPGFIATPMTAGTEDFIMSLGDVYPIPAARAGTADEVAGLLAYLLGPDAGFFCGSVIYMDGGTDAALRAEEWPTARG